MSLQEGAETAGHAYLQYATADRLRTRMETHRRFEERPADLDAACALAMALDGTKRILDVGCGTGQFLAGLASRGHRGRLVGLDRSIAMIETASATTNAVEWLVGDAAALPFAASAFDWVSCRHVLFHVPAIPATLAEIARVAGPVGRALFVTNSRRSLPIIYRLLEDVAVAFGLPEYHTPVERFCVENARETLAPWFATVEETIDENALVFNAAEPIVQYVLSCLPLPGQPDDPRLTGETAAWVAAEVPKRLAALGGRWRDARNVGFYACKV